MMVRVGDIITTSKSGVKGTVAEVIPNANGKTARVRLVVAEKWTTVRL